MSELMDGTTVQMASGDGLIDAVKAFVEAGNVGPNTKDDYGYTAMHAAVSYGQADVLRYLLSVGGDVNVKDQDGDTPLHVCETAECAQLLLDAGADLMYQDDEGKTPYHIAVEDARDEMVSWFKDTFAARGLELPHVDVEADEEDEDGEEHEEEEDEDEGEEADLRVE